MGLGWRGAGKAARELQTGPLLTPGHWQSRKGIQLTEEETRLPCSPGPQTRMRSDTWPQVLPRPTCVARDPDTSPQPALSRSLPVGRRQRGRNAGDVGSTQWVLTDIVVTCAGTRASSQPLCPQTSLRFSAPRPNTFSHRDVPCREHPRGRRPRWPRWPWEVLTDALSHIWWQSYGKESSARPGLLAATVGGLLSGPCLAGRSWGDS